MMRLPALLQPWSAWLAPFPAHLAGSLGTLLLRLAPLLGPLRRHAAPQAHEPAGIGDIVRRGSYDRLLISEWALADAAPEEFMRRAAGGELLFTGPEPANSEESLRSVVLLDAGPAQLGEARLVHLAMLILLARRAAMAGAEFHWGVLQAPGTLHAGADQDAMRRLLDARTWAALDADGLLQWNAALGDAGADCWLVGDPDAPLPAAVQSRVLVQRAWLADELEVTLSQRRRSRTLALPLPRPADSVRLLRRTFDAPVKASSAVVRAPRGTHSLKRPPLFGTERGWLAIPMVDGSVTLYNVPHSPQGKAGRPRNRGKLHYIDHIIAAGLFHKTFGTIVLHSDMLTLYGFPGLYFRSGTIPLPDRSEFQAVSGALRWMPVFHIERGIAGEQLLVIDKGSRLVAWTRERNRGDGPPVRTTFRQIANKVLQAAQTGNTLYFAVGLAERTDIYRLDSNDDTPRHQLALPHRGNSFFFGDMKGWRNWHGIYLMRLDGNEWLAGERDAATTMRIDTHATVLGVARHTRVGVPGSGAPAAVVLHADRRRIALHTGDKVLTLVDATEHIAQASFDPLTNRVAWLGRESGALSVMGISTAEVLLRALPQERGGHES
jgi:hypothetical protein